MSQSVISFDLPTRRLYSVSELTESMRFLLTREFSNIWVSGEVSGLKLAPSGHCYFTLKDGEAQVRCACWTRNYRVLRFKPKEGMAVLVRGAIDVYAPRGEYQLIVETIVHNARLMRQPSTHIITNRRRIFW